MIESIPSSEALLALLRGRRSIRRYLPDPVPEEMVAQILEAGRWAPSASNRQPWSFIVVQDEKVRRQVAQHAAYYFIRWAHVGEAPLLIVLCGDARSRLYRQFLHEDIGLTGVWAPAGWAAWIARPLLTCSSCRSRWRSSDC